MSKKNKIKFKKANKKGTSGYLYLPNHPKKIVSGIVSKTLSLADLIDDYQGIPVYLDFDDEGELIGIEIL